MRAAPSGPSMRQLVCRRMATMWRRSSSSSGTVPSAAASSGPGAAPPAAALVEADGPGSEPGSTSLDTRISGPGERITARSMTFSSSRTLPGHG